MSDVLRTEILHNGLKVYFHDHSHRYYGNFHRVRIEVRCAIPVKADLFEGSENATALLESARSLFGEEVHYQQTLDRMGVAGEELDATKESLVENFIRHTFGYLEKPEFARRFVEREMDRRKKVIRPVQLRK